jgi:hypothetical protein
MEVNHTIYSGKTVNRSEQYNQKYFGQNKHKKEIWDWNGVLRKNHDITMIGELYQVDGIWHYSEEVFFKKWTSTNFIDSTCKDDGGEGIEVR